MTAISCYPDKKGMVTGIIIACFAFGSFIFNFVATAVVNPENKKPSLSKTINGVTEKFFDEDVSKNVPKMFLVLAGIYTAIIIPALFMIKDVEKPSETNLPKLVPTSLKEDNNLREKEENEEKEAKEESQDDPTANPIDPSSKIEIEPQDPPENENKFRSMRTVIVNPNLNLTLCECFRTKQFYQIFFATMLSGTAGMFALASFKTIGFDYGYDDGFLTLVGSIGAIFNGIHRPLWGHVFDKKGYKFANMMISTIQIAICFTFPSVYVYKASFFIWLCILFICSGGIFTQLAPISVRIYGRSTGVKVYAFFMIAMGFASMCVYFIQVYVVLYLDNKTFFYILGALSTCSLILNFFFDEIIVWDG